MHPPSVDWSLLKEAHGGRLRQWPRFLHTHADTTSALVLPSFAGEAGQEKKAVVLGYPGAVGPDIPGVHSYLVVQAQLTLGRHLVEGKQGVQLAKARGHEAPIGVE